MLAGISASTIAKLVMEMQPARQVEQSSGAGDGTAVVGTRDGATVVGANDGAAVVGEIDGTLLGDTIESLFWFSFNKNVGVRKFTFDG